MSKRPILQWLIALVLILASLPYPVLGANELRFASFPDVSTDSVVFAYRDSIWVAPVIGGTARLLSDVGSRPRHPKFSPDGSKVAYTASVDDNTDIFVVDLNGGAISRLTQHPARDNMVDWYPDGRSILFKSTMQSPHANYNRLFQLDAIGGLPHALPLPYGETAAVSTNQRKIYFTYLRDFQEEVWKRYYGGRAPDIWSYDAKSGDTVRLTDHAAPDSVPMPNGSSLYFLSERGTEMRSNIWRLDQENGSANQLTNYEKSDVRNPSIGPAGIVYELDGGLFLLNLESGQSSQIPVGLGIARQELVPRLVSVGDRIESTTENGSSTIAIEARGDIFLYDSENDIAKNVTNSSQSAERYPSLSPDGSKLAYFSDRSGEYQLTIRDISSAKEDQLTKFDLGFRYRPFWSPDGRYLSFMDYQQVIWLVDTKDGDLQKVDQGQWRYHWDMPNFRINWSHDSQWLTYSRGSENRNNAIYLYNAGTNKRHQLTSGFYNDFDPVFDPSGNYLAALSYRNFAPVYGDIDTTFVYTDSMVVSVIALRDDVVLPNAPDWSAPEHRESVEINLQGAETRLAVLPLPAGKYAALAFQSDAITVAKAGSDGGLKQLLRLDLSADEPVTLFEGSIGQVFDVTEKSTIVKTRDDKLLQIFADPGEEAKEISISKLTSRIDRRAEYLQMFDDSWRYQRDFYYDPGLHGVDWDAARDHYRPQAAAAHSDQELTAIIRELHGELAAGHIYVSIEPPYNRRDAKDIGLLGVDFAVKNGAYVISKILNPGVRQYQHGSPLDNPALDVSEGDYLLAVNGRNLNVSNSPWEPFAGLAGQHVELTVADTAGGRNKRTLMVKTLNSERKLRELVWAENNRKFVDAASDGQIGYIYVPNTGSEGLNELMQAYRAQYHKKALIIDERFNRGGALGDRFVELLNRPPLAYFSSRNGNDYPLPELSHRGAKAMLINSWSYSGGDGFPFLFKTAGAGPLIGTRTWGGLIGPGMRMSLVNGGFISAPPQRVYDIKGQWAEGNEGVEPNIPVLNDPGELARGHDQQMGRAIELLLQKIEQMPPVSVPAFPAKTPDLSIQE